MSDMVTKLLAVMSAMKELEVEPRVIEVSDEMYDAIRAAIPTPFPRLDLGPATFNGVEIRRKRDRAQGSGLKFGGSATVAFVRGEE